MHNSGWLYRFAIDRKYPYPQVIEGLTRKAIQHSASQGWGRLETVTTECQDEVGIFENPSLLTKSLRNFCFLHFYYQVRESYSKLGFTIRQVYHRQIVGSSLRVMKTQLGLDVVKYMAANVKNK